MKIYGTISNKKVVLRIQANIEYLDLGVLEYWGN